MVEGDGSYKLYTPSDLTTYQIGDIARGEIVTPGEIHTHTFQANPDQRVFFDVQASGNGGAWSVVDSAGTTIFRHGWYDEGPSTLELGGVYTITVNPPGDHTDIYQFQV